MNEEQIIVQAVELEKSVDVGLFEENIETTESVAQIDIIQPEEMIIDVEEVTGVVTGMGESADHTHQIEQIVNLENKLITLGTTHETYSPYGGYAEFRTWKPLAQNTEVGRFVGLVYQDETDEITGGNTFIEVCDGNTDIYGVTVGKSAFCGYQDSTYCLLDSTDNDNSTDTLSCAKVCLLGVVSVRQGVGYTNAKVGDYVVSDSYGCAIRSKNGVGFRVVGVGQYSGASDSYWNYKYVDIALVPQNDNVARVMAELEGTKQNLGNLSIQIGKLEDDINNSITSIIPDIDKALEDVNDAISDTQTQLGDAKEALDAAQQISSQAKESIETAKKEYMQAVSDAQQAVTNANNSLSDLNKIKEDLKVLDEYEYNGKKGMVGVVAKADDNSQTLATLNTRYDKMGNHITLINQKIDENGAAIEHLVAHADKYSVGDYSLTHNLTCEEARGLLGDGEYVYIPTLNHTEESPLYIANLKPEIYADTEYYLNINDALYSFVSQENLGNNYILEFNTKTKELKINSQHIGVLSSPKMVDTKVVQIELFPEVSQEFIRGTVYVWNQNWEISDLVVSFSANEPTEDLVDGYLWYVHDGWRENDVWVYEPRTLYRYSKAKKTWIAVARANDGNSRTMSFINQTAKEISSAVTNLGGDVSEVKQTVNGISSTVSELDGDLTRINQTAEAITLGAYSPNKGMSSLEILLNGMRSTTSYDKHVIVGEFGGKVTSNITRYEAPPTWEDGGFSFDEVPEVTEETYPMYYFDSDKRTYYCKQIDDDTYKIYTIGNQAMANISTRVGENETAIAELTLFEADAGPRLTAVEQKSDENSAQILSIAQTNDVVCTEIKSALTDKEKSDFEKATKYSSRPVWNVNKGRFEFTGESSENGVYCMLNDTKRYYKIIDTASGKGYEQYELSSVKLASIEQKVDDNGASIGMIVKNNKVQAGVVVDAINDSNSVVMIEADKIRINGTTTFTDVLNPDTTTISGDYIRTGIMTSNNYDGNPIKKFKSDKMYGVKIGTKDKEIPVGDMLFSFKSMKTTYTDPMTGYTEDIGGLYWYVGTDISNIVGGTTYYTFYNNVKYEIKVTALSYGDHTVFLCDPLKDISKEVTLKVYASVETQTVPAIVSGTNDDYITYCFRKSGQRITLSSSDTFYYFGSVLSVGTELTQITKFYDHIGNDGLGYTQISSSSTIGNKQGYIIYFSDFTYFDGTYKSPSNGTKLDLDIGSIYSKSFILNEYGDTFLSGNISIQSGYIGDKDTGFEIAPNSWTLEWSPSPAESQAGLEISAGKHYFIYNGKYYSFELDEPLSYYKNLPADVSMRVGIYIEKTQKNLRLCVTDKKIDGDMMKTYYDVVVSDTKPSDGTCINLSDWTFNNSKDYYIGSKQRSLLGQDDGEKYGAPGVFISPEGIGLGHGRFWVNNTGTCLSVAGANMRHWNSFDDEEASIFAIETANNDEGSVFATRDMDDNGWAAIMITPKSPGLDYDNKGNKIYVARSTIDVWASIDMNGHYISNQSDSRLKTNIVDTDINAVNLLNSIELKSFDWINSGNHVDVGLIAQQLEKVMPSLVTTNERTGLKGISYIEIIPYLIKAIQELSDIVNPPIALMSLNAKDTSDTHWVDDMSYDEKLHYVNLSKPLTFKYNN